jgi:putative holliday junction resolvase
VSDSTSVSGTHEDRSRRVLGVDLGAVRIGLALSDPDGIVATPLETLTVDDPDDLEAIVADLSRVSEENDVGLVVVGLPKTLSGREGRSAQRARRLAERLAERADVRVDFWDERFTSAEADRAMIAAGARRRTRRGATDRVAATLLLQAFLDARRPDRPGEDSRR